TFYFFSGFPALLLLLALPESCMAGEDTQVFLHTVRESSRANGSYDMHKNLHEKKFWCKELSEKSCPVLALSSPLKERINLNCALHCSVDLTDFGQGWFYVIMTALPRENSGTYQRGDLKNILLQRIQMVVSLKGLCKMVSQIRCHPIIRGNPDQSIVKVGRTEMMNDFARRMIRVWLQKLRLNDSGEDHLESHFQGRNKLLNRIMLEVLGENWNNQDEDLDTISFPTKKGFLPATTALIATVILLVTTYIRRKRAEVKNAEFLFNFSFSVVSQDGRNKGSRVSDGELNDNAIYAVIRHQPQLKPEDVTCVNVQPSPEAFFHAQEPPGNSVSSGSVEYATVIFRATTPHSGTEKEKSRSLQP
ncbi:LOW QUALITY PROTEIN: uncharacterized protein FN964_014180, partial [Alca torda]